MGSASARASSQAVVNKTLAAIREAYAALLAEGEPCSCVLMICEKHVKHVYFR
jgi:hypothetical protein